MTTKYLLEAYHKGTQQCSAVMLSVRYKLLFLRYSRHLTKIVATAWIAECSMKHRDGSYRRNTLNTEA